MLGWIKMARSTFYYHRARLDRNDGYDALRQSILNIYNTVKGRYGYRRICCQIRNEGIIVNHKTVQKLMQQMKLKARRRKQHYHSYKGEVGRVAPNVLDRDFSTVRPNQKWTTDVTQISIGDRKIYLSPIMDMFNGEIISYTISDSPNLMMATSMLKKAFRKYQNLSGLILHSDQGWHYQHRKYQQMLKKKGIIQSMSRKGNCLDNAMMENFFALMKNELLYINNYSTADEFIRDLKEYIKWYNCKRIKLRLKGLSPVQYRAQYRE